MSQAVRGGGVKGKQQPKMKKTIISVTGHISETV